MATSYISVVVLDRNGKGKSGVKIETISSQTTTDDNGQATITTDSNNIAIFIQGSKVYDGFVSNCPNPIIYNL